MNLMPLSVYVFSLLAGGTDMGGQTSDVKGEIMSRYKSLQVEESYEDMHREIEPVESDELT